VSGAPTPRSTASNQRVLLVHSGGFSSRQWRKLAESLAPEYRVDAPDLLGYGTSEPWRPGAPFHFRDDLARLVAQFADDADPLHVVGHSYGGFLALQLALARPQAVRSLALFEPVAFGVLDRIDDAEALRALPQVGQGYPLDRPGADEAWLLEFVDWWNGEGAWQALPEETRASFREVAWKLSREVASLVADRTDRASYGTIAVPTLLLGGDRSPPTEQRVLAALAAALPHASLQILPGVGHMGPITHPAVVNAAIRAHLAA